MPRARHRYIVRQKRSLIWYYDYYYYYYHTLVRVKPKIKIQNNNFPAETVDRYPCTHIPNETEYLHINCRFTHTRYRRCRRRVVTHHNLGLRTQNEENNLKTSWFSALSRKYPTMMY